MISDNRPLKKRYHEDIRMVGSKEKTKKNVRQKKKIISHYNF